MFKLKEVCFAIIITGLSSCAARTVAAQLPYGEVAAFAWRVEPAYGYRPDGRPGRAFRLLLKDSLYKGPVSIQLTCGNSTETVLKQKTGTRDIFQLMLPAGAGVDSSTTAKIVVSYGNQTSSAMMQVPKRKQWTVYIYPHSHLDIGYTALPDDVKKLQQRNIDVGIDIAEKSQGNPAGSRFTWNPEATWVVNGYLEHASPEQKKRFITALKNGWLHIDGGHSNSDLSTMSDEEIIHFFHNVSSIEKSTGTSINTMVQMDLPGAPWGLVTVASQFGINRFISFPNNFDLRKK